MIDALRDVFGSALKSLDVLYTLAGHKPCARILVKEGDLSKVRAFLKNKNLKTAASDFKIQKESGAAESYSDKGVRLDADSGEEGYYLVYASKDASLAQQAKHFEEKNDHLHLGLTLGYPKCCCEFFARNFPAESKKKNDYTLGALRGSEGYSFPFQNNIAARFLDVGLLSHFPCHFGCEASKKIAEKNLEAVKKHSSEWATLLTGMLQGVALYSEENGIFLLRNFSLKGNTVFYSTVMASANNEIYKQLREAPYLEILGKNAIKLNGNEIHGFGVMVFT